MHRPLWRIVKSNNNKNNNIPMERAPGFVTGGVSAARRSAGWARPALLPHPCPGRGRRLHGPGALAVPARASTARSRRVPVRTYHQVVKGTTRSCPPRTPVHLLPQDSGLRASTRQRPPARPAARAGADADERLKPVVPFS